MLLTTLEQRGYDSGGRLTSRDYANGVAESRVYNADNTLASIGYVGAPIGDLSYTWDDNHNKTSETIAGTMSDYGFTATYDAEDRLVSWDRSDSALDQSWNLSAVGDWNSITENSVLQSRTHGPTHELLTAAGQSVTHDAKGNTTLIPATLRPAGAAALTLNWDQDNRLSSADTDNDGASDVYYEFDALGRRVARSDSSQTTVYVQNGQQTMADYNSGASPSSPTYTYVWGDYIDELIVRDGLSGRRFYHRNQQYSITALTDSTGAIKERYAYTAYGTPIITDAAGVIRTTSTATNRYTYTGREWDKTLDLYHYRARMYDSVSGRFCSRDPIGYPSAISPAEYDHRVRMLFLEAIERGFELSRTARLVSFLRSNQATPQDLPRAEEYLGISQREETMEEMDFSANLFEAVRGRPLVGVDPSGKVGYFSSICLGLVNNRIPFTGASTNAMCFGCAQSAVSPAAAICNLPSGCCRPLQCILSPPFPGASKLGYYHLCMTKCVALASGCRFCA